LRYDVKELVLATFDVSWKRHCLLLLVGKVTILTLRVVGGNDKGGDGWVQMMQRDSGSEVGKDKAA
jgi:hypothetical protein